MFGGRSDGYAGENSGNVVGGKNFSSKSMDLQISSAVSHVSLRSLVISKTVIEF